MTRLMTPQALTLLNASPRLPLIAAIAVRFAVMVVQWDKRHRTRRNLARLDAHLLRDIGLSEDQARGEYNRWFWQA